MYFSGHSLSLGKRSLQIQHFSEIAPRTFIQRTTIYERTCSFIVTQQVPALNDNTAWMVEVFIFMFYSTFPILCIKSMFHDPRLQLITCIDELQWGLFRWNPLVKLFCFTFAGYRCGHSSGAQVYFNSLPVLSHTGY